MYSRCLNEFEKFITDKHDGLDHKFNYDDLWHEAKYIYDMLLNIQKGVDQGKSILDKRNREIARKIWFTQEQRRCNKKSRERISNIQRKSNERISK